MSMFLRICLIVLTIILLRVPSAQCQLRVMDGGNLQAPESVLKMRGYKVKVSDGVVAGEPIDIKRGTATMFIRGCTTAGCWVVFMVQTKCYQIILLRVFPANPPEKKFCV